MQREGQPPASLIVPNALGPALPDIQGMALGLHYLMYREWPWAADMAAQARMTVLRGKGIERLRFERAGTRRKAS